MNTAAGVFLVLLVVAAGVAWRRGVHGYAAGLAATAVLPGWAFLSSLAWPAIVLVVVASLGVGWHRWARTSATVTRWSSRSRRKAGVASTLDVARHAGTLVHRLRATTVRPSLAELDRRERLRLPTGAAAVELCRTGVQRVWASIEDVVLVFGGPRTGKSGWLAARIIDAPGAVVVTSTRTDLLELAGPLRARDRGPVFVFNAVGLAGIPSSITFDPLTGCHDPVTAVERATDMVAATSQGHSGERAYWEGQARRVLAALLHAAALGRLTMADVLGWVADPNRADREVPALLRRSGVQAFEQDATQFITTNDRTRTSITSTLMPTLGWLTHPAAAAAAAPGTGFDVAWLLEQRATVFLLGAEEANTGPLVCALTGHIAREARRLAVTRPSGRLDPNLTLALDEAALISPVPLENWTADMGGRGVTIIAAFQSRAQLLARYGEHKTATTINNTAAVMLFGGTRDRDDLGFWATLAGERDERITTTDLHGRVASRTVRKVPVLSAAQLANLPRGKVVVYRRGIPPVIGRARMAWRRRDVRTVHQQRTTTPADARPARRFARLELLLRQARRRMATTTAATSATERATRRATVRDTGRITGRRSGWWTR